jgi:predicted XRE-type DNA-binding protein
VTNRSSLRWLGSLPLLSMRLTQGMRVADLGLPNPEQQLMQAQAAKVLGVKQPHVSSAPRAAARLMRNRVGSFSVGRLMEFVTALGQDLRSPCGPPGKGTWPNVGDDRMNSSVPVVVRVRAEAVIHLQAHSVAKIRGNPPQAIQPGDQGPGARRKDPGSASAALWNRAPKACA